MQLTHNPRSWALLSTSGGRISQIIPYAGGFDADSTMHCRGVSSPDCLKGNQRPSGDLYLPFKLPTQHWPCWHQLPAERTVPLYRLNKTDGVCSVLVLGSFFTSEARFLKLPLCWQVVKSEDGSYSCEHMYCIIYSAYTGQCILWIESNI